MRSRRSRSTTCSAAACPPASPWAGSRAERLNESRERKPPARAAPPGRGTRLGFGFPPALRGRLCRLRRLSRGLWAVDGARPRPLWRAARRPALCQDRDQHPALCRLRCERHDVRSPAAVGLLPAPRLVGPGAAGRLPALLGIARGSRLHLLPLDADRRAGPGGFAAARAVRRGRPDLVQRFLAGAGLEHRRLHLEVAAVLDPGVHRRAARDPAGDLRGGGDRRRGGRAPVPARRPPASRQHLRRLHAARDAVDGGRLHHGDPGFDGCTGPDQRRAGHARHTLRLRRRATGARRGRGHGCPAAPGAAGADPDAPPACKRDGAVSLATPRYGLPAAWWRFASWRPHRRRRLLAESAAWTLGLLLLLWSLLPTYNMLLIALDEEGDIEYAGIIWPAEATLDAFRVVLTGDYWYLQQFWLKFANSFYIALATMLITIVIGSLAAFALGRMKLARGWLFGNFPVLTYAVPASFLVIPFYRIMRVYGLSDSLWAVIAADVAFATPYAILILQQYAKLIPREFDEAAQIDGAGPWHIYRHLYLPLTAPALAAVGTFALLFAWNEYVYQYVLLTSERKMTVAVAIAQFFNADEAPWNYMMATAIVYALPPVAIFFALRRWMLAGLTLGGVRA